MKVLFCTPYLQQPDVIAGGINVWGHNIIEYNRSNSSDVSLCPISFDRQFYVQENTAFITRIYYGIKEYSSSISRVKEAIRKNDIDVLHLCTSAQLSLFKDYYILRYSKRRGIKSAIHFHFGRIPELLTKNNWEGKLIKRICRIADSVIVIDQKSENTLKQCGYNNVYYLPNPLSNNVTKQVDIFEPTVKRVANKVLYVGNVIPTKGVYELVKACSNIENIELHLVGHVEDQVRKGLTDIAYKTNNGKWLKIRGGMPHEDVVKEMLSSGIFALPSYTEGFPNVILEAMASGCAIVATPVGEIPEMLRFKEEAKCGIEVEVKSIEQLKVTIENLLRNPEIIQKYSSAAKERVVSEYSMPIVWNMLKEIWKNTI